jgi:hypothetical protein
MLMRASTIHLTMMKNSKTNDINVIVLRSRVHTSKADTIFEYIDVLKTCRTSQDFYSLFDQFYDEVLEMSSELFVEKQIQLNAEILEKIRKF